MVVMALLIMVLIGGAIGLYLYMRSIKGFVESYAKAFSEYTVLIQHNNNINAKIDADIKNLNAMLLGPMIGVGAHKNTSWS